MILEKLHRHRQPVAVFILWCMGVQTTLPAIAGGGEKYYLSQGSQKISKGKNKPARFVSPPQMIKSTSRTERGELIPPAEKEIVLQSEGPSQPEMATFQSVGSDNMVDPFTGDMSYNIPLLDVGGYPVNIHYNSGISMDQEASWVGLGWNINPGTIGRTMRGLPDDFNGDDKIVKTFHTKPNITAGLDLGGSIEIYGLGLVNATTTVTYDNYRGYGLETGLGINSPLKSSSKGGGTLSGSLSFTNSSTSGIGLSAGLSYSQKMKQTEKNGINGDHSAVFGGSLNYNSRVGLTALSLSVDGSGTITKRKDKNTTNRYSYNYSIPASINFNRPTFTPGSEVPYASLNSSFHYKFGASLWGIFPDISIGGSVSSQFILPADVTKSYPAYGYLNFSKSASDKNSKALLDYNRENDGPFIDKITPAIAIPQYTYDVYTISAEGTGGSFRPYRSDAGYIYTPFNRSGSGSVNVGLDIGALHIGGNMKPVVSVTTTKAWEQDNKLKYKIGFQQKDSVFEDVVFRNPMEMPLQSQQYLNAIGHDTLIRPVLEGAGVNATLSNSFAAMPGSSHISYNIPLAKTIQKEKREKRNQVISYLSASDASEFGLDKKIVSYSKDYMPYTTCDSTEMELIDRVDEDEAIRKKHHLSEITVLNDDARRYIYGIPAYTISQTNMTFAVTRNQSGTDLENGLTSYTSTEATPDNTSGVDGFFSSEIVPAYAHSFLLSGILSPDYIDVTGNGITEDDIGDAVKFNYTRVYSKANDNPYGWRTPAVPNRASFAEGLKTYSRDDKASIVYGSKEVWYLHSVVSKNLVAVFRTIADRSDATSVDGVDGEMLSNPNKLLRLNRIDLYSKADLVASTKNHNTPRPIKSVLFEYDYSLCVGANPSNPSATGKLTLKKIKFTYNGNDAKQSNAYEFSYNGLNAAYHPQYTDTWGNYKSTTNNPGLLPNQDYPYVNQAASNAGSDPKKTYADQNASAWCLTDIKLPSKGLIKIIYESDDYAYVQNRRAMQFFKIAGLGTSSNESGMKQEMYNIVGKQPLFVFVDVPDPVYSDADVRSKYLEGIKSLYLKFFIEVPTDRWGSGSEFVPIVCDLNSFGYVPTNPNRIWIEVKEISGSSPFRHSAFQFLKENLSSKAFPGSETGSDPDLKGMMNMMASQVTNITQMVTGFENSASVLQWCRHFNADKSFIKLDNPFYKKLGGGLRVKFIQMFDNFNTMASGMVGAMYGQTYDYTTSGTVIEHGVPKTIKISSGVASFEPFLGGEENAVKGYYAYQQQMNALGPTSFKFVDTPFCQSLYPGASVGYSKVTIQTINREYLSANGKEVYTFYTYKDFPTRWSFTPFDENSRKRHHPAIGSFLKLNAKHYLTLSQGFKIEMNDMHGKMRSHAFYSESDPDNYITYTENFYRTKTVPGELPALDNKVWATNGPEAAINTSAAMGQNVEIMTDLREQTGFVASPNTEFNVDFITLGLVTVPLLSFWMWPQWERTRFRSASVLKVVNDYGILDSVYAVDKGSVVGTKNLIYDSETGGVLLTRTNNEYRDPVYNFNYPAHWAYSGMGMAYKNIHARFRGDVDLINGRLFKNNVIYPADANFESGDECVIRTTNQATGYFGDPECGAYTYEPRNELPPIRAWVLDAKKGTNSPPQLFFIDGNGNPLNIKDADITILRSGHRNFTGASVGNITMLTDPVITQSGKQIIKIDDSKRIVNASAATFRDCWKVENHYYAKDTVMKFPRMVNLVPYEFTPINSYQVQNNRSVNCGLFGCNFHDNFSSRLDQDDFTMADFNYGANDDDGIWKSWLRFNLNSVPKNSLVHDASLSLIANRDPSFITFNQRNSNECYVRRATVKWNNIINGDIPTILNEASSTTEPGTQATIPEANQLTDRIINITELAQNMIADRESSDPAIMVGPNVNNSEAYGYSRQSFYTGVGGTTYYDCGVGSSGAGAPGQQALTTCPAIPAITMNCYSCNNESTPYYNSSDGKYYCQNDVDTFVCKKHITDTTNPYRWGVYGNWRPSKSYVFYHERNGASTTAQPDLRNDGTLKDFIPFWTTTAKSSIVPTTDTVKWVWNAASRLVNSKGAEVENVDALGRFNSAHYGYNNNLPVATVQNAQYRQAVFDGFEDYSYKDRYCEELCPNPRFADFVAGGGVLTGDTSHTGLYSLRLGSGIASNLEFPIYDAKNDTLFPCPECGVKTKIDSIPINELTVTPKGTGLSQYIGDFNSSTTCQSTAPVNFNAQAYSGQCSFVSDVNSQYEIAWSGYIQLNETGLYIIKIDGGANTPYVEISVDNKAMDQTYHTVTIANFVKGALYPIVIFCNGTTNSQISLTWTGLMTGGPTEEVVPAANLYLTQAAANGSVTSSVRKWCVKMNRPKANVDTFLVLPPFSPVKSKNQARVGVDTRFIVSAWVREALPCSGVAYTHTQIDVSFDHGGGTVPLAATGVIIEGWQRMEAYIPAIPDDADKLKLHLYSTGNTVFYVDDIRIHPFNANMKSMVYNPLNLRLMAELDENNYASFYEYDDDGTLVRVKKETEKGIKTIKETRSALYKP